MKFVYVPLYMALLLPAVRSANILFITGNSNGTVPAGELSIGDSFLISLLEDSLQHNVTLMGDSLPGGDILTASNEAELIILSESITSPVFKGKMENTPTPILNCEAFLQDDFAMTSTGPSGDPGTPEDYEFGVIESGTEIDIVDPFNVLSAGLTGTVAVYKEAKSINWGKVGKHAKIAATLSGDPRGAVLYYFEKGDSLYDGSPSPGLRINFFLEDDNVTGSANYMTEAGIILFMKAVAFGLGQTTTSIVFQNRIKKSHSQLKGGFYFFKNLLRDVSGRTRDLARNSKTRRNLHLPPR